MVEVEERAETRTDLPVLSLTKTHGPILASERFSKVLYSRNLSRYRVARRGLIVADPMLLWDGAIGVQRAVDAGLVSPDYRVYKASENIDSAFLARVVKSPTMLPYYQGGARGTNIRRNRIARSDFLQIPFALPPLGEQRKIAAILSAADDAIEATRTVIDQLLVVKRAMMVALLSRGLPGRHTLFKQTEIGEVPLAWDPVPLHQLAVVQTGIAKGKSVERGQELPYLRVANVQDGYVDLSEVKTIMVAAESVERYSLRRGDVLFTEGGDADKLGRGCVWYAQIETCLHQNHVFAVRVDESKLMPQFLAYWAASPRGKSYFLDCAKQTTNLASINSTQLKALPVPFAPLEEQSEIVAALDAVAGRIEAERVALAKVNVAKSALMSALLSGEVRVTPDEVAA